ncbi:MAG TPA: RNA polymerase sigma factor [Acidimicrobiales bacterium]|nr:RNA polymerase sigma factor [Acidimicrobiales bacterium]
MDGTDTEAVERSPAGDGAAFVELFWHHGPAVHGYLSRRAGRQDADELLSEVWLRAFRSRSSYDHTVADTRPWLYGIARNVLRAHWRGQDRTRRSMEPAFTDPWPEADDRLDAFAQREALERGLATLSEDEREVLLLVVWEHLTPAQAAEALAIPQGTARSRLHRARTLVRDAFEIPGITGSTSLHNPSRSWSKEA